MGVVAGVNVDVGGVLSGIGTLAKDIRTAITGEAPLDPNKRAEIELKLIELETNLQTAQAKINEVEAASPNIFVSGWRPAIGWICGISLFVYFIVNPIGGWAYLLYTGKTVLLPALDVEALFSLVVAMLGLGGYRTFERIKGVQRDK